MSTGGSGSFDLAHWILRFIAYVVDSIILLVASLIIGFLIFLAFGFWIDVLIFGLLSLLYFTVLDVVWGGTIGKRFLGFHVQEVYGGRVSLGKSIVRNISKIFIVFLFLDWLIGVATSGHDKRQKWSDHLAGTIVVR